MRIDIYHHINVSVDVDRTLAEILTHVRAIQAQGDQIMATEQELKADLDTIQTGVATVIAKVTAQAQTIADLQAQIAAGTPVTQSQLDELKTEADAIVAALTPAQA